MNELNKTLLLIVILSQIQVSNLHSQGPARSYYYDNNTVIPWASLTVKHPGGSQMKIPFLPVIDGQTIAPLGSSAYSEEINASGEIVFVGNGTFEEGIYNSYYGRRKDWIDTLLNVKDKIVLMCPDLTDSVSSALKEKYGILQRISEVAKRNAAGLLLFWNDDRLPFLRIDSKNHPEITSLPVITITKTDAIRIFSSIMNSPGKYLDEWPSSNTKSRELQIIADLQIDTEFERIDADNFSCHYRSGAVDQELVKRLVDVNERSIQFLLEVLNGFEDLQWTKRPVVYYSGFDSKVFFTHHWGSGMATPFGSYNVIGTSNPDFGLTVHENTHMLQYLNYGGSSSFISEGFARYTEALATDPEMNDRATNNYLAAGQLFSLKEMLNFNIGQTGPKTDIGYPAAGSFIGFIADTYGQKKIKDLFTDPNLENFGKPIAEIEKEWHHWIKQKRHDKTKK